VTKGFTDIAIRNLAAGNTRREIPDLGCAGLYVIVQPSGKKSYAVRFRFDGRPKKLTLPRGLTLAAARKLAGDALLAVEQGRDPAAAKATRQKIKAAKANTVQALCENYLTREAGKLRTGHARQRVLERLVYPEIGGTTLADLKRSHIVAMLDKIEDECGAKMADLTLAYVRKIFNWHASRVDDFNSPLARNMSRYDAKAHQGTRVLNDDEIRRLWDATGPSEESPFHALIRFLLLTGARRREVTELPWNEIDGTNWLLPAARHKNKTDLTRPLSKTTMTVLRGVPTIAGGRLVFSLDGVHPLSLTEPTAALKEATGVAGWRVHDLRRTARTLLSRAGVDSDIAERCLGHTISGVRRIYDHHNFHREMLEAYEKLSALIERITNPSDTVVAIRGNAELSPQISADSIRLKYPGPEVNAG